MLKKKILVIEDDADIREIIRFYLEEEGFCVVEAADASSLVELAEKENPDLITLDIKLPGIDGIQAIRLLKENAPTSSIPVLVISVIAKDPKVQRLAANGYIAKPFEKNELIGRVKGILGASSQVVPAKTVLIVDDEREVLDIISHQLKIKGFSPLTASSGQDAIRRAFEEKPDLIILDIRMPQLDGFEVIDTLSQNQKTWSIPIVVLSGVPISEAEKEKSQKRGVRKFLSKPFEPEKLIEEIEGVLCEKKKF